MLTPSVGDAIDEIRGAFGESVKVVAEPDGSAWVELSDIQLPSRYQPDRSFVLFRVPAQYPYADIYPVFVIPDLSTKDGDDLGPAMTSTIATMGGETRAVTQISRRSNRLDGAHQSVVHKIDKVLNWMETPH